MLIIKEGWNYEIVVDTFTPARPAPMAQTPDSPGYSDPGDDEELEFYVLSAVSEDPQKTDIDNILSEDEDRKSVV